MNRRDGAYDDPPKYSIAEIERRWLVDIGDVGDLAGRPFRLIEDLYIENSRLRLRAITEADGGRVFKLGKKYGKRAPTSEPITMLYLTESEHRLFAALPGARSTKRRYALEGGSVDLYESPPIAIFEVEFVDEATAAAYRPPAFAGREITNDPGYTGAALAGGAYR